MTAGGRPLPETVRALEALGGAAQRAVERVEDAASGRERRERLAALRRIRCEGLPGGACPEAATVLVSGPGGAWAACERHAGFAGRS